MHRNVFNRLVQDCVTCLIIIILIYHSGVFLIIYHSGVFLQFIQLLNRQLNTQLGVEGTNSKAGGGGVRHIKTAKKA